MFSLCSFFLSFIDDLFKHSFLFLLIDTIFSFFISLILLFILFTSHSLITNCVNMKENKRINAWWLNVSMKENVVNVLWMFVSKKWMCDIELCIWDDAHKRNEWFFLWKRRYIISSMILKHLVILYDFVKPFLISCSLKHYILMTFLYNVLFRK